MVLKIALADQQLVLCGGDMDECNNKQDYYDYNNSNLCLNILGDDICDRIR